jgi:hypothetical protein
MNETNKMRGEKPWLCPVKGNYDVENPNACEAHRKANID